MIFVDENSHQMNGQHVRVLEVWRVDNESHTLITVIPLDDDENVRREIGNTLKPDEMKRWSCKWDAMQTVVVGVDMMQAFEQWKVYVQGMELDPREVMSLYIEEVP